MCYADGTLSTEKHSCLTIFSDNSSTSCFSPTGSPRSRRHPVTSSSPTHAQRKHLIGSKFRSKSERHLGNKSPTPKRPPSPTARYKRGGSFKGEYEPFFICGGSKGAQGVIVDWQIQGGRTGHAPPRPNSLVFMLFSAKNFQNNSLVHPLWELAPLRKILDPPLQ